MKSDAEVKKDIGSAFQWQTLVTAKRIQVEVEQGWVTRRGTVHSWPERAAAQGAAWSAPGIRRVVNELKVGS